VKRKIDYWRWVSCCLLGLWHDTSYESDGIIVCRHCNKFLGTHNIKPIKAVEDIEF